MTTFTLSKKELKTALREVLSEELTSFRATLFPLVSKEEQKDIDHRYGKPSRKSAKSRKMSV